MSPSLVASLKLPFSFIRLIISLVGDEHPTEVVYLRVGVIKRRGNESDIDILVEPSALRDKDYLTSSHCLENQHI